MWSPYTKANIGAVQRRAARFVTRKHLVLQKWLVGFPGTTSRDFVIQDSA